MSRFYADDRPVPARGYLAVIGLCGVSLGGLLALARSPDRVERWFVEGFGSGASRFVDLATGWIGISLAEWVEAAVIAWLVLAPLGALVQIARRRRSPANALAHGVLQLAALASFALATFYFLWGLNYARAPAATRLGWEEVGDDDPAYAGDVARLASELLALGNDAYRAVNGTEDAGAPTGWGATTWIEVDRALDLGYGLVAEELGLSRSFAAPRGRSKPLLFSPVFSWLGIGGFYFPFTAEANVNTGPPAWSLLHTIAHEKAHQRGIASEDEANFFGFLACVRSEHPAVRYSGWLFAQRRLLDELLQVDPEAGARLVAARVPGVQRDVDALYAFWEAWRGRGTTLGATVNDAYLRTNQVEGGILSYSLSARLLVAYARERQGSFRGPPPERGSERE